jgi:cysteinyl-tRNA synthetase
MRWLREEGWKGEVLRWALLSANYREPMDWNDALLKQAEASLARLYGALERVWGAEAEPKPPASVVEALCDDLNTPKAIAELFALASAANKAESDEEKAQAKADLLGAGALLGVLQSEPANWFKGDGDDTAIDTLVEQRAEARRTKNWAEADRLRGELDKLGVVVMDDPKAGTSTWRRI